MRYPASEKLEIIRLVDGSSLSVRRTLAQLGIPRSTFYGWYDRFITGGPEALEDRKPQPRKVWNKVPDDIATAVVDLALEGRDVRDDRAARRREERRQHERDDTDVDRTAPVAGHPWIPPSTARVSGIKALFDHAAITIPSRRPISTNLYQPGAVAGASGDAGPAGRTSDGRPG